MAGFRPKNRGIRQFKPSERSVPSGHHELMVESLADDARGVARPKGKTTFVQGGLPGERVKVKYSSTRKQFDEAMLLDVLESSPQRVEPGCEHYSACGGCNLQHLAYAAQVEHKENGLKRLFSSLPDADLVHWLPAITAEPYHYRHRIRMAISADKQGCVMGYRAGKSHVPVNIQRCSIAYPQLNGLLPELKRTIAQLKGRSQLRECLLSVDGLDQLSIQLLSRNPLKEMDINRLKDLSMEQGVSIQLSLVEDRYNAYWHSDEPELVYHLADFELEIHHHALDFTQVNPAINQAMVSQAVDWLQPQASDRVADFFAGVGNFSLPLAKYAGKVQACELVPEMVNKLTNNARLNGLSNLSAVTADLFGQLKLGFDFNKALLDPPRAGAEMLCQHLASSSVSRLVYVSCNPQTLKRDLTIMLTAGFKLERACLVDMFPQTHHAEAMVLLSRR